MRKALLFGLGLVLICQSVGAQTVANRVRAIDGQTLPGDLLIPAGIGAGVIHQQLNNGASLTPKKPSPLQSRAISGIEAAKRGDAHWANSATDCFKIGKRINKKPKEILDAKGKDGGVWCIFPGEQASFGR